MQRGAVTSILPRFAVLDYNPPMEEQDRPRRRLTRVLFLGNALASTSFIIVITVAALAAEELVGSARLAGVPSALGTVGSALGASLLTAWSQHWGRRLVFSVGFATAAVGATIGAVSLGIGSLGVLLVGMVLLGFGRSVCQLSRFAAGDLWAADKRASAMGFVVWAATIGAVLGPLLVVPASKVGTAFLGARLAGPYAFCALGFALSALWYLAALRPEPLTLAAAVESPEPEAAVGPHQPLWDLIRQPTVQLSFLTLAVSQGVMVLVMTMTPLHVHGHGHGLALVSGVMAAHTLGMFGLSPLTGFLVDRWGGRPMVAAGSGLMMFSTLLAATASQAQPVVITLALFFLGVGWNFGFVAGSTLLQEGLALAHRLRLQGIADSLTWASGGLAALASGFVVAAGSFQVLALVGATLTLLPLLVLWRVGPPMDNL